MRERTVFGRFPDEGRRARHGPFWLSWIPEPQAVPPGLAFAIGRRVGGAVVRNRLRRRLRAAMAARADELRPGWYLVGCSQSASGKTFHEMNIHIDHLLRESGALR